jgi:hypothetical protein
VSDLPTPSPAVWFVIGLFLVFPLVIFGVLVRRIRRDGAKVRCDEFALPELLITLVLAGYFAMLTAVVALHPGAAQKVNIDLVLPNAMMFVIFTVVICAFLRFRGLRLRATFGLDRLSPGAVFLWALSLIAAAFPFFLGTNAIAIYASHGQFEQQPLVNLFNDVARHRDYGAIAKIVAAAVLFQPICEEFLFRGFFYGVWKRYLGPWGAGFFACLLFAAFHTNLVALPSLFALAAFLTIAYERTGSLLVPMAMHAIFNLTNLLLMISQAQSSGSK